MKRRHFFKHASLTTIGMAAANGLTSCSDKKTQNITTKKATPTAKPPIVICTWNFPNAVSKTGEILQSGGKLLDALEQGCMAEEADINNKTVGKGGRPDRDGNVTLDACIMNKDGDCGAVVYLQNITHAISVARKVMEETPHVMLAGKGAEHFAVSKGMKREKLLTEASKKEWKKWLVEAKYDPIINIENHDTIGMLAMDKNGDISGACTTSGLAYKMSGRVGDSPIIGAGLFIDNEVGGCVATGVGEEVIKTVGSFLVVELMRQGKTPNEACKEAIMRIVNKPNSNYKNFQVGYIAINKQGETGSFSIHEWFSMTQYQNGETKNHKSRFLVKAK